MVLYLTFFSGALAFVFIRSLVHLFVQLAIPPVYTVRSVETAGYISDFIHTKRLVWLNGVDAPIKIVVWCHPHEGDECLSKEYWIGKKLILTKPICLASKATGELNYL